MTVVEVRGRGGQLLERFRSGKGEIHIGRAFDNDIIVEDRYICPHHLRLTRVDQGWKIDDLDSLNGFRTRARRGADPDILRSGDRFRIGHTTLYVYDGQHAVEETLELDGAEARFSVLGRGIVWPAVAVVSVLVFVQSHYWRSYVEFQPLFVLSAIFESVVAMTVVAAFWALLGRLLRHKASFFAQLSLWLIYSMLSMAVVSVAQWVGFNANSRVVENALEHGLGFGVLAFVLWGTLLLATNLRARGRLFTSLGISSALLAINLAAQFQMERGFSPFPDYYARMKHSTFFSAAPDGQRSLVEELTPLFDRADADVIDDESE